MFYTQLRYRWIDETAARQTTYDDDMLRTRLIGMMDSNFDGKVQKSELRGPIGDGVLPHFEQLDVNKDGSLDAKEFEPVMKMLGGPHKDRPRDKVASK